MKYYVVLILLIIVSCLISLQFGRFAGAVEGHVVRLRVFVFQLPELRESRFGNSLHMWVWSSWKNELIGFEILPSSEINYGSYVVVEGKLQRYTRDGMPILHKWILEDVKIIEITQPSFFTYIHEFRENLLVIFRRAVPYRESSLLVGMVLGYKGDLDSNLIDQLIDLGLIHVVVASGFNIFLIASPIYVGFKSVTGKWGAFLFASLAIFLYVILIGGGAPVMRAAVMGMLALLGNVLGRVRNGGWLLLLSILLMLAYMPVWIFDVGWQLSVGATAGLIWLEPLLRRFLIFRIEVLRTSFAAQIAVLPILLDSFGEVSWISLVANVMLLWIVPVVTQLGMLAVLSAFLSSQFAHFLLICAYPLLCLFVFVVSRLSLLVDGQITISDWGFLHTFMYYFVLIISIIWLHKKLYRVEV